MTAPVFLVEPGRLDAVGPGDVVTLDGPEGRHAAKVRRMRAGEAVTLADGQGRTARGEVQAVGGESVQVRVAAVTVEPEPSVRFVLVQALAKGGRDEQAVETATEYGVDAVIPWQASRCVVQWKGERGAKALRKWQNQAVAAAKQARRTRIPDIRPACDTKALVGAVKQAAAAFVLHEEATEPLAALDLPAEGDVLVIVGPEGGITPDEVAAFEDAGAQAVRLGSTVMRASSAGPAALAVLSARERWR